MNGYLVTLKTNLASVLSAKVPTGIGREGMLRLLKAVGLNLYLIAIILLLIVGVSGYAQSEAAKGNANSNSGSQQNTNASNASADSKQTESVHPADVTSHKDDGQPDPFSYKDIIGFGLTFALLLVVIGQAFIARRQNKIADQQREILQRQIDSAAITERAYVNIADMKVTNLALGQSPVVTIQWVNGGRTPASHFQAAPILIFAKELPTKGPRYIDEDISEIKGSFIPAGAKTEKIPYPQVATDIDIANFEAQRVEIFIIGSYRYVDIKGVERVEPICALYDRWGDYVYECYDYSNPNR